MNSKWLKLYNQLLKGKLTRDDQHQIEREALDDPFLADALEGLELYHGTDRGALQDRLEQRLKSQTKPKVFKLWKYAAAASIVLVAGVFFFLKPNEQLSLDSDAYGHEITTPSSNDDIAIVLASEDKSLESIEDTAIHALISHGVQEVDITDSKVDRIHPKRKQLVKASDDAMVHVVSNTPESDIGLSTQAIISAADHANSQLSDNLKTARGRAIPAPAKMPIGLAESDDPMPVHQSNEIAYIPNLPQIEYATDTFPKIAISKIALADTLPLLDLERGMVSINGRIVDLVNSIEFSPSIISNGLNPQQQLVTTDLRQLGNMLKQDTLALAYDYDNLLQFETSPVIGWAAFDSILQSEVRRSSQMPDVQGSLLINFDAVGNVQSWDAKGLPDSSINALLQQVGPWNIDSKFPMVIYPYDLLPEEQTVSETIPTTETPYPQIGWDAFADIIREHTKSALEILFLKGINRGTKSTMVIEFTKNDKFSVIDPGVFPVEIVEAIIKESGKWIFDAEIEVLEYDYVIEF